VLLAAIGSAAAQSAKLPADVNTETYSRLPMLKRDQVSPDAIRVFDLVAGKDKATPPIGPGSTYIYSPGAAEPLQQLNQYLRKTVIGPQFFEICALLGARDQDQAYEWSAHEVAAQRVGVAQPVIDAIKYNRDPAGLPEKEASVIQFGRDLLRKHRASPEQYAKIVQLFGKQGLTELTATIGDYVMVAIMLNAVDQQLPPDRKPLLPPVQ
jgi:4-carboxymuconolactone decarboxylase